MVILDAEGKAVDPEAAGAEPYVTYFENGEQASEEIEGAVPYTVSEDENGNMILIDPEGNVVTPD